METLYIPFVVERAHMAGKALGWQPHGQLLLTILTDWVASSLVYCTQRNDFVEICWNDSEKQLPLTFNYNAHNL